MVAWLDSDDGQLWLSSFDGPLCPMFQLVHLDSFSTLLADDDPQDGQVDPAYDPCGPPR